MFFAVLVHAIKSIVMCTAPSRGTDNVAVEIGDGIIMHTVRFKFGQRSGKIVEHCKQRDKKEYPCYPETGNSGII
jgi:hypothetical protein